MSTYSQKLTDPRWQKKRLEIFQRDGFKCRWCNSLEKTLHVHHLFYFNGCDPWEYEDDTLITLCKDCHDNAERVILELRGESARKRLMYSVHRLIRLEQFERRLYWFLRDFEESGGDDLSFESGSGI